MSNGWFKDAKIYHIFIDRFAGYEKDCNWEKPIFCGGNLKGIIEKIPYFEELGVNTIWLSPFYENSAYHGYHIKDFFKIDKRFGTLNDLKFLIERLHKKNMKIIVDFVPNHCSNEHPYFIDAQENKNSKYKDWFYFKRWPNKYVMYFGVKELPKLNLENMQARKHLIESAKYWLSLGIDGFRLDHVLGPSHNFWKEFRREIKKDFPNSVLIGEAWINGLSWKEISQSSIKNKFSKWLCSKFDSAPESLMKEYIGEMDGVLDFKFFNLLDKYLIKNNDFEKLRLKLKKHYNKYPKNYYLPTFIDNHDVDRFLFRCKNKEILKEAIEFQFSISQAKIIYYGTEIGMSQKKSMYDVKLFGDVYAREPMKWEKIDKDIFEFYKKLLRKN